MYLKELVINSSKGFLGATYTFLLERKKLKKDVAEEKISLFEEMVDKLYDNNNHFKTKFVGKYVEIKESNNSAVLEDLNKDCESDLPEGLLCSSIKYSPKKGFFKKATITVSNKGNNPSKISYFNEQVKNLNLGMSDQVVNQMNSLEETIKKYKKNI